jgi:hypothetical protein
MFLFVHLIKLILILILIIFIILFMQYVILHYLSFILLLIYFYIFNTYVYIFSVINHARLHVCMYTYLLFFYVSASTHAMNHRMPSADCNLAGVCARVSNLFLKHALFRKFGFHYYSM